MAERNSISLDRRFVAFNFLIKRMVMLLAQQQVEDSNPIDRSTMFSSI